MHVKFTGNVDVQCQTYYNVIQQVSNSVTTSKCVPIVLMTGIELGASATYSVLASSGITNIPLSAITGDIGLYPDAGAGITGLSEPLTCPEITGNVLVVDETGPGCATVAPTQLLQAKTDAHIAYTYANAVERGVPASIEGDLNGLTLPPGLYQATSFIELSVGGHLYLDALGNSSAVFVLRSAATINTETGSIVHLMNGAQAKNVYWTAASSVSLGSNSVMKGTILASTGIVLKTGANLQGRAITQSSSAAAVTLDAVVITIPN